MVQRMFLWRCVWLTGNPEVISSPVGLVPRNALVFTIQFHLPDKLGGFNGSMQHLDQTHIAMKTKAKDAR
jgi:hypothetical protein